MNDICSNDHNTDDNNNTNLKQHEGRAWGTCEELLLACAVKRHGFCDWDSVAAEVRTRTSLSAVFLSADDCRQKYRDLQRRFKESADDDNDAAEEEGGNDIPWLEELRSLRVAELRREVEQYDVSILYVNENLSLQLKVKKLEEERDGGEKLDLVEEEEEERKRERSENDGGDKAVSTAEESERENRSMNESNSTGSGEKTVGEDEPGQTRGDDVDPDPVNTAEEGSGASDSGRLGESGTSGRKWKRKRRKDSDGEIRSAASESQPLIRLLDLIRSHPRGSLFERRVRSQDKAPIASQFPIVGIAPPLQSLLKTVSTNNRSVLPAAMKKKSVVTEAGSSRQTQAGQTRVSARNDILVVDLNGPCIGDLKGPGVDSSGHSKPSSDSGLDSSSENLSGEDDDPLDIEDRFIDVVTRGMKKSARKARVRGPLNL
ncbi:hypothetical protein F2Q68_00023913 [Brassica cretica]|uniref:Myb-like domain-containing protein n=1 Tax=Brassica cretica TaxID=69181 RepID=A0A8S9IK28_BRACR|nr:hypothetical protein F2Q68_00023913 [Brassica cretica]